MAYHKWGCLHENSLNNDLQKCIHAKQTKPILFFLVVDEFGIKYVGIENVQDIKQVLGQYYEISTD